MPPHTAVLARVQHLIAQGAFEHARAILARRLQHHPDDGAASNLLAIALTGLGQNDRALFHAERARTAFPGDPGIVANLGHALAAVGRVAEAVDLYQRALDLAPDRWDVCHDRTLLLLRDNRPAEARASALEALRRRPDDPTFIRFLGAALLDGGYASEALDLYEAALEHHPTHTNLLVARATTCNHVDRLAPERIADMHRAAGSALSATADPLPPSEPRARCHRPLRVGFVSSDLRQHSVAFFLEPVLLGLDRTCFEPLCFSSSPKEDRVSLRLRTLAAEWHTIHALSDAQAARLIRNQRTDILVDLGGLGTGHRLGVFAHRPAPVQATYLGYPNTTGMTCMDFRVVDAVTDPPGFEDRCTERLVRLANCFVCYSPLDQVLPEPAPRGRGAGGPVFGSFNSFRKMTDPVVSLWTRIVNSVPGSRLVLKSKVFAEQRTRDDVAARFKTAGLDPTRLDLLGWVKDEPMLLYAGIDVALDPFPYNGTTTTCEALWMGVPVVTLEGTTHAGRVGASLLTHLGRRDLVAATHGEYADIAAALAGDTPRLDALRRDLRPLMRARLGDSAAFGRDFGAALESMWSRADA